MIEKAVYFLEKDSPARVAVQQGKMHSLSQ